jgi:hypothetical protein
MTETPEIPEPYRLAAAMRTCGDPDCTDPGHLKKPYRGESGILDLSDAELDEFIETIRPLAGHWHAVSVSALADLKLVADAATLGDDSPIPSGSVSEAVNRLELLLSMLAQLDEP